MVGGGGREAGIVRNGRLLPGPHCSMPAQHTHVSLADCTAGHIQAPCRHPSPPTNLNLPPPLTQPQISSALTASDQNCADTGRRYSPWWSLPLVLPSADGRCLSGASAAQDAAAADPPCTEGVPLMQSVSS